MEYGKQNVHNCSIMGINRNNKPEDLPQANYLAGSHGRDEILEYQQEFQALRRKRNQNQRELGSHKIHREFLEYGTSQSYSETPRLGGRNYIFSTEFQKLQALQTKVQFIQDCLIIPGSYQQNRRS
ncbi:hypothetical protein O181_092959 [Austropuccinia psidii MF-1]|uniref:Uncharacterized protein n=1 Tax=Austropuccinia psidii MF-1 TaxID=1389203 RepID=A0A9Q3J0A3_9BASI|nr:hypothetical protein [Austropuccinia psidii MF-1]